MQKCTACGRSYESDDVCPVCGYSEPAFIGDENAAAVYIKREAAKHRLAFLKSLDLGVTAYFWKDDNGVIAEDRQERLSLGSGESLWKNTVWAKQSFARIPDLAEMTVELSVLKDGKALSKQSIRLPVPAGQHLLQLGMELGEGLTVQLKLKNPLGQTQSQPVALAIN